MKRVFFTGLILLSVSALADNYSLATIPPYLGDSVEPNVFYMLDDSGSMDWEILSKEHKPYCYYKNIHHDSNCTGGSDSDTVTNGNMKLSNYKHEWNHSFYYLYYNTDNHYTPSCGSGRNTISFCSSSTKAEIEKEWRHRSSSVNVLYYNPSQTYLPWEGKSDADYNTHVLYRIKSSGQDVLLKNTTFVYYVYNGNGVPDWTALQNGEVDKYEVSSSQMKKNGTVITDDGYGRDLATVQQNIANWHKYYRRRIYVVKAAVARTVSKAPSNRYGFSVINRNNKLFVPVPDSTETAPFIDHNNNDILPPLLCNENSSSDCNQFSGSDYYYHASGSTPLRGGLDIAGTYYAGNLSGKTNPIISECQQNFTILFTDGYWNGNDTNFSDNDGDGIDDTVADIAKFYYDKDLSTYPNKVIPNDFDPATWQHMVTFGVSFGVNGKLVDTDGNGWPDNNGVELKENDDWGDPSSSSHTQEKIDDLWHASFNSKGRFVQAETPEDVINALEDAINTIASRNSSASAVSLNAAALSSETLLYQAKFNSGGWYGQLIAYPISTTDGSVGSQIWDAKEVLDNKSADNRIVLTYNPTEQQGVAFRWPADYTNLQADELDNAQVSALLTDYSSGDKATYGTQIVNYLRGDDTYAGTTTIPRDNRTGKLGDIVNSTTFLVQKPLFRYSDDWSDLLKTTLSSTNSSEPEDSVKYSDFKTLYKDRSKVIYVGANDGMLHGFFAEKTTRNSHTPGEELLAYIPNKIFPNLHKLTQQPYQHLFFVDGSPVAGDVLYDSAWHTVLVSGLGAGGQGIFALDITNPDSFSESGAANVALWEFTDKDDEDLGYTFSTPSIVRLHNGVWAAVFGNGYNNTETDAYVSQDNDGTADDTTQGDEGQAALYIVNIKDGSLIKKFETKIGISHASSISPHPTGAASLPNGLSTPAVVDVNNDHIADYVYAGDLYGNLWKFDINDTDPANWKIANNKPLFTACETSPCTDSNHQPITVRPQVGLHPTQPGYLIYFGTGKYFEEQDNTQSNQKTQSFYAVWDKGDNWSAFDKSDLLQQKILKEVTQSFDTNNDGTNDTTYDLRVTSQEVVDWSTQNGWYMDLVNYKMDKYNDTPTNTNNYGERTISNPILRNNKIIFTTLIPPDNNCAFGGDGWLMELDAFYGGRLDYSPFDLNKDDKFFNPDDFVNVGDIDGDGNDDYVAASGKKNKNGIGAQPGILANGEKEYKYSAGSNGSIETTTENPGPSGHGRQSWNELL